MLKKRIIPVLLLKNGRMVKGKNFNNYIDTGDPNKAVDIYSSQDADELIFINISKDQISKKKFLNILNRSSKECTMPLCAGGGITNSNDVKELLELGADKVLLNTILTKDLDIIKQVSSKFGAQCIVAGIDYKKNNKTGKLEVWSDCGKNLTNLDFNSHIKNLVEFGVGEIFINSINNDGMMNGYDLEISQKLYDYIINYLGSGIKNKNEGAKSRGRGTYLAISTTTDWAASSYCPYSTCVDDPLMALRNCRKGAKKKTGTKQKCKLLFKGHTIKWNGNNIKVTLEDDVEALLKQAGLTIK